VEKTMNKPPVASMLVCLATAAVLAGSGRAPGQVSVHRLVPGGWVFGSWCVDLTGTGRKDILLQIAAGGARQLVLFRHAEDGFRAEPSQRLPIPVAATYYVAGAVGPGSTRGVLFLGRGLARFHRWDPESKRLDSGGDDLFAPELFPSRPDPKFCYAWRVRGDLDGDGRPDLLLPVETGQPGENPRTGFQVFSRKTNERYAPSVRLDVPVGVQASKRAGTLGRFRRSLPMPTLSDIDGDGRLDVMVMVGARMIAFRQADGQGLQPDPFVDAPLRFLRGTPEGHVVLDRLVVADLDGDLRADLLYMRKQGRVGLFGSLRTRIALYLGPFHEKSRPDQILNLSGLTRRPRLFDFDGDGDLDILLSTLKVDLFAALRHVVGDDVPAIFRLHRFDRGLQRFEETPFVEITRGLPFDRLMDYGPVPLVFLHGDFDGDGAYDLLEAMDANRLEARAGRRDGGDRYAFAAEPLFSAETAYSDNLYLDDLTGEGRTDVLTFVRDRATVVLCR